MRGSGRRRSSKEGARGVPAVGRQGRELGAAPTIEEGSSGRRGHRGSSGRCRQGGGGHGGGRRGEDSRGGGRSRGEGRGAEGRGGAAMGGAEER